MSVLISEEKFFNDSSCSELNSAFQSCITSFVPDNSYLIGEYFTHMWTEDNGTQVTLRTVLVKYILISKYKISDKKKLLKRYSI